VSVAQRREGEGGKAGAGKARDIWEAVKDRVREAARDAIYEFPDIFIISEYFRLLGDIASRVEETVEKETGAEAYCDYKLDSEPVTAGEEELYYGDVTVIVKKIERMDTIYCRIEGQRGLPVVYIQIYGYKISAHGERPIPIDYMLIHDFEIHPRLIL